MKLPKTFLKHPVTQYVLSWLLAGYIWLCYFTNRRTYHNDPQAERYIRGDDNCIFAFWHGRMMMMPTWCPPKKTMRVLISHHRDGMLISSAIGHFGQKTISGSTSRGGREAVVEILRVLEAGDNVCITPDGPRGPAQIATKGIVAVARHSGKPVIPVTFSSTRAKRLGTWDRFMLALPFGRMVFYAGTPIMVDATLDEGQEEGARLRIETAMNGLVQQADSALDG